MSERPLPRSPLGPPPADPLGTAKPAEPKAHESELVQIAKLDNLILSELRGVSADTRRLSRISGTLSAIAIVLGVMLLASLGMSFGGLLTPRAVYEYAVIAPDDNELVAELDKVGDAGWQIVSARRATSSDGAAYEILLMRRK